MAGSALLLLMPAQCTRWTSGLLQPLGWLQWAAGGGARAARGYVERPPEAVVPRDEFESLRRENERLRQQIALQRETLTQLNRHLDEVTRIDEQMRDPGVAIHVAAIVAADASPTRRTLTIARGTADGIRVGDWVIAGHSPGDRDPTAAGRELLARQWLVGRVAALHRYVSVVQLTTDPGFGPLRIWAARLEEGVFELGVRESLLYGTGDAAVIRAATENFVDTGFTIAAVRLNTNVPIIVPLGRMVRARPLRESALHFDITVAPWDDARRLTHVYVLSIADRE